MSDSTWLFVEFCWIAWVICWVVMAFGTKRTIERGGLLGYRLVALVLVIGLLAAGHLSNVSANSRLWQTTFGLGIVTDCMVFAGAAFSIWARITLGRNWSVNYGRAIGFVLLFTLCASVWWKARQEEQIMSRHFPDAYADYKTRVRAIVPFAL